ncbi:MAG: polysaccharide pyruvyl transferase family protein, partial [Acutalibacteraceae bacterium]|nr:polysaccharide pyruvyl transferase family protein [Acutalibacteraceae bacterium]
MKVLIYYPPNKLGMSDFRKTDYSTLAERARNELDGKIPNFGNKVWLQGILAEITSEETIYEFGYDNLSEDYINNNYDCVLMPLANCFRLNWVQYMEKRASHISKLKIPVYVIACGIQAKSYDELNSLVESIKEPSTKFIKSVYNTGGEFALRGYFTAEFFEKLGFKNAVVTGCPSIFQMGRDLTISNEKVSKKDFVASINGTFKLPVSDKSVKSADFICQDVNGKVLYDPKYFESDPLSFRRILKYIKRGDYDFVRAAANNKIKLFADTQQWMSYYIYNSVDFSFGSRIHGTIMPILSGVPSLCYT